TRTNPGSILLGEIVSRGEAKQYLKAANLGRRAYSTIHGADVRTALGRLEQLALGDQPDLGLNHAFEHLRVPAVLTNIVAFLYRYLFVLTDEVMRLLRARESRSATVAGQRSGPKRVVSGARHRGHGRSTLPEKLRAQ
ncbi:MAG: Flp pilus assembly complex ATPase component TadA, partial [Chloroflexi bacterium]|nr:Flp pilus assembly complex ATPase component TadA [Chloroflexota bacterium]